MTHEKQPRATKEDLAEIRAGRWDGYGDMSRLIRRLTASLADARKEAREAKATSRRVHSEPDAERNNR